MMYIFFFSGSTQDEISVVQHLFYPDEQGQKCFRKHEGGNGLKTICKKATLYAKSKQSITIALIAYNSDGKN